MSKVYDRDSVFTKCVEYFDGDELAANVCMSKYLMQDKEGNFLESSPDDVHRRLAKEFARVESNYPNGLTKDEIYKSLKQFKHVILHGSPMYGVGNDQQLMSVANCFVIPSPHDSIGGICKSDEMLAQIMKRRGGVGIDISTIRPATVPVHNAAKTSAGATCFMNRFSNTTLEIAQNGRRGAAIITLDCSHPDLEDFIKIKRDLTRITGANISIKWNDEFLQAIENNEEYVLRWPIESSIKDAKITKTVKAKEVWDLFVESNWLSAEPGCLFWDTVKRRSISDCYADVGFRSSGVNPCGEVVLSNHGACILISVNMKNFIRNPYTENAMFDEVLFQKHVRITARLADDLIDLELEKCQKIVDKLKSENIEEVQREIDLWNKIMDNYRRGRRVGIGFTGLADMLASIGIEYGSDDSFEFVDMVLSKFQTHCYTESAMLAKERGAFPEWDWDKEHESPYIVQLDDSTKDLIKEHGRRNIASNTCAPAGSISIEAQVTSGGEPLFKAEYIRNKKMTEEDVKMGKEADYTDPNMVKWISSKVVHKGVSEWKKLNPDSTESPYVEAGDLDPIRRVRMQATVQKYIDHSISSTINLPADVSQDIISKLYLEGWKQGCKGLTIYRDGCRDGVLVTEKKNEDDIIEAPAPKRPEIMEIDIHYSSVNKTPWIFFVGKLNGQPYEIFGGKNENIEIPRKYKTGWIVKNGMKHGIRTYDLFVGSLDDPDHRIVIKNIAKEFSPDAGTYTRMLSMCLRHGIPIKFIVEQIRKDDKSASMISFEKVVARILSKYIKNGEHVKEKCKECGNNIVYKDGCQMCMHCGNSKCL
jgi:ribonucleoside-diphosphate reductase alpha chain